MKRVPQQHLKQERQYLFSSFHILSLYTFLYKESPCFTFLTHKSAFVVGVIHRSERIPQVANLDRHKKRVNQIPNLSEISDP